VPGDRRAVLRHGSLAQPQQPAGIPPRRLLHCGMNTTLCSVEL